MVQLVGLTKYSVIGGGDSITATAIFDDLIQYSYVCTTGGAKVRFLAGKKSLD